MTKYRFLDIYNDNRDPLEAFAYGMIDGIIIMAFILTIYFLI